MTQRYETKYVIKNIWDQIENKAKDMRSNLRFGLNDKYKNKNNLNKTYKTKLIWNRKNISCDILPISLFYFFGWANCLPLSFYLIWNIELNIESWVSLVWWYIYMNGYHMYDDVFNVWWHECMGICGNDSRIGSMAMGYAYGSLTSFLLRYVHQIIINLGRSEEGPKRQCT